jgi:hypothetical protein
LMTTDVRREREGRADLRVGEYGGKLAPFVQDTGDVQFVALGQLAEEAGQHHFPDVMELDLGSHGAILLRLALPRLLLPGVCMSFPVR